MSESLLALDLALNTGYASWTVGDPKPRAGLLEIDRKLDLGKRLASLYKWTLRVTKEWGTTDICIESPLVGNVPGHQEQFWWLISAFGVVSMAGAQCNIRVSPIANASMIVHWCGTKNIEKKDRKAYSVVEAQRRGFPGITDHNTADALGLLSLRCSMLNLTPPWDFKRSPGPLFTQAHKPAGVQITNSNKIAAARTINKAMSFNKGEG